MSNASIDDLRPALDRMTSAQQNVMKSLNQEELNFAVSLQRRLDAVSPEIEGQRDNANNLC